MVLGEEGFSFMSAPSACSQADSIFKVFAFKRKEKMGDVALVQCF